MTIAAVIALLFNFIFGITILIYYFMNFKSSNLYMKYGGIVAGVYMFLSISSTLEAKSQSQPVFFSGFLLIIFIIYALKTAIYTCTGFLLCSNNSFLDMPLLRRILKEEVSVKINYRKYIIYSFLVILGSSIFTAVLFKLTSPEASELLKNLAGSNDMHSKISIVFNAGTVLTVLTPVISEELIFRLILQNFLFKILHLSESKYWIVIIISSAFWALCHSNTLSPEWVKLVQIFPIGIALGALYKKFGLESSIIAHGVFNVVMVFFNNSITG